MMNLAEYCRRSQSPADFLPWAALVGQGVILKKDGSFQRAARFRGPHLDSATPAELVAITSWLNNALRRLGSRRAVFIEAPAYCGSRCAAQTAARWRARSRRRRAPADGNAIGSKS